MIPSKVFLTLTLTAFSGLMPAALLGQAPAAQAPAAAGAAEQRQWKDRAEYDLYQAAVTAINGGDPATAAAKLDQWVKQYPETQFTTERQALYSGLVAAYAKQNKAADALNAAKMVLTKYPDDFTAQYYITLLTPQVQSPTPDQLDQAQKAANGLLNGGLDKQFAADKKPPSVNDADWKKARTDVETVAHTTLGWVAMQQKHNDVAEKEFKQSLQIDPKSGNVAYWLANTILAEKKPEQQSEALYYYARAAAYDGPGSLSPDGRKQVQDYLTKAYTGYHGSKEGLDQLMAQAKTTAMPPPDFKVMSNVDLEKAKLQQEEQLRQQNPQLALWLNLKQALTGPDGASYFTTNMKDTLLPEFSGKVISVEPATRSKTVVLAIENTTTPDATLEFESPVNGKIEVGQSLSFRGIATSYTANPFMVTFKVEQANAKGIAAAPAAARPAARRPAARRRR